MGLSILIRSYECPLSTKLAWHDNRSCCANIFIVASAVFCGDLPLLSQATCCRSTPTAYSLNVRWPSKYLCSKFTSLGCGPLSLFSASSPHSLTTSLLSVPAVPLPLATSPFLMCHAHPRSPFPQSCTAIPPISSPSISSSSKVSSSSPSLSLGPRCGP